MPRTDLHRRLTVVLLTHNCVHRVDAVMGRLTDLGVRVVAVDNASSDGTTRRLRQLCGPDVEVVGLETNIGAAARNVGARRASTPYLLFCDDDGWYDSDGLEELCDLFDRHPALGLVNTDILVGEEERVDPIAAEMRRSPIPDRVGIPGTVLLGFMAGACMVRRTAYLEVGGYDERFFIGGEEEALAFSLAKAGWQMRFVDRAVMHHYPSLANYHRLRGYGMRNTLWSAWLHRRLLSALRYTWFTLLDTPKTREWLAGVTMALRGLPWILRERHPMSRQLDGDLRLLDRRRYAGRRPVLTFSQPRAEHPANWPAPAAANEPRAS